MKNVWYGTTTEKVVTSKTWVIVDPNAKFTWTNSHVQLAQMKFRVYMTVFSEPLHTNIDVYKVNFQILNKTSYPCNS